MEDYPINLLEFEKRFATEDACRQYFFKLRWPEGFRCPGCDGQKAWLTERNLYHCGQCGTQTSLLSGTIFQDTKKLLQQWFNAIWHITNQKYGANALGLQRILGFGSYRASWACLHKLRRAMVRPGRDRLSGVVEVDETFIGGEKPGKRGRGAAGKELVVIAAQKDGFKLGGIRLQRIPDASGNSLKNVIQNNIEPGGTIQTDGWQGHIGFGLWATFMRLFAQNPMLVTTYFPKRIWWHPCLNDGCWVHIKEPSVLSIWTIVRMSIRFVLIAGHPDFAENYFTDCFNRLLKLHL